MGSPIAKTVYGRSDSAPSALYAKRTLEESDDDSYPVLVDEYGAIATSNGLKISGYDYVAMVISPATTETYTFRRGGASGTIVATVVIVYTDSTREDISTVTKS